MSWVQTHISKRQPGTQSISQLTRQQTLPPTNLPPHCPFLSDSNDEFVLLVVHTHTHTPQATPTFPRVFNLFTALTLSHQNSPFFLQGAYTQRPPPRSLHKIPLTKMRPNKMCSPRFAQPKGGMLRRTLSCRLRYARPSERQRRPLSLLVLVMFEKSKTKHAQQRATIRLFQPATARALRIQMWSLFFLNK
jgi:hypothetical protein